MASKNDIFFSLADIRKLNVVNLLGFVDLENLDSQEICKFHNSIDH